MGGGTCTPPSFGGWGTRIKCPPIFLTTLSWCPCCALCKDETLCPTMGINPLGRGWHNFLIGGGTLYQMTPSKLAQDFTTEHLKSKGGDTVKLFPVSFDHLCHETHVLHCERPNSVPQTLCPVIAINPGGEHNIPTAHCSVSFAIWPLNCLRLHHRASKIQTNPGP